jgi:hypothetical protein
MDLQLLKSCFSKHPHSLYPSPGADAKNHVLKLGSNAGTGSSWAHCTAIGKKVWVDKVFHCVEKLWNFDEISRAWVYVERRSPCRLVPVMRDGRWPPEVWVAQSEWQ